MNYPEEIKKLAEQKKAIIVAHNYQTEEVQDLADFCGDSLELAQLAKNNTAERIVFCGVYFMAEAAAILSPEKKVILPDLEAGCPLADTITKTELRQMKKKYPAAEVVVYINSSAATKTEADVICTSSNAVKVVNKMKAKEIIFAPDKNLANYVQRHTDKKIIPWPGFCPTHENFSKDDFLEIKNKYPEALSIVHPECRLEIIDLADEVLSTGQMVKFVKTAKAKKIIVGTEKGMIHKLKSVAPQIEYILAAKSFTCPNMKKITPKKIYHSLLNEDNLVKVDQETSLLAEKSLDKMLSLS